MARIVDIEVSKLLKSVNHPGVDTVLELRQRRAATLYKSLVRTNEEKRLVRKLRPLNKSRSGKNRRNRSHG